jgi:oligosaccharide translocation protein RFT1
VLSEGDKLVTTILPLAAQGVYALVVNYGSLLARLVFLPIEEASRNSFSQILSSNHTPGDVRSSVTVLSSVLRAYIYLSCFALVFGPHVAPFMLRLLVSPMWLETDASQVLAMYTCYIPFLAFNGILEAFVQSVASVHDISRQSRAMAFCTLSFIGSAYFFLNIVGLGATGLVFANMVNMSLRIMWCSRFISNYYSQQHTSGVDSWSWLKSALPSPTVFVVTCGVGSCAWYLAPVVSLRDFTNQVTMAMFLLLVIAWNERMLIKSHLRMHMTSDKED